MKDEPLAFFPRDERAAWRAATLLAAYFAGSLLAAALLTPLALGAVHEWQRRWPTDLSQYLHAKPVDDFFTRCWYLALIVALPWLLRRLKAGQNLRDAFDLRMDPSVLRRALLTGMGAATLASSLILLQIAFLEPRFFSIPPGRWPLIFLSAALGAMLIAILEEFLFRGVLFRLLLTFLGPLAAIAVASMLFSGLHFLHVREAPEGGILSGFATVWALFSGIPAKATLPGFISLFLLGVLLCLTYRQSRNLWLPIALHAGLVAPMLIWKDFAQVDPPSRWLGGTDLRDGWLAPGILFFAVAALVALPRLKPSPGEWALWQRYRCYLRPLRFRLALAVACGIVYSAASGFGLPFMADRVFPPLFAGGETQTWALLGSVALLPAIFLLRGAAAYGNAVLMAWCGAEILHRLRTNLFAQVQRLSLIRLRARPAGETLSRLMHDTEQLQRSFLEAANDAIKQPLTLLSALAALLYLSVRHENLATILLALAGAACCVWPVRLLSRRVGRAAGQLQAQSAELSHALHENLAGALEVRAYQLEQAQEAGFRRISQHLQGRSLRVAAFLQAISPVIEVIAACGVAAAVFLAAKNGLTLATMLPLLMALYLAYEPIKKIGRVTGHFHQAGASLQRIDAILAEAPATVSPPWPQPLPKLPALISFEDVHFSFPGPPDSSAPAALRGVSATIAAGEFVALAGPSGAGKTTFAGLLPRFFDPTRGTVSLGGVDLRKLSLAELRAAVAFAPQEPLLFAGTVAENIALGLSEPAFAAIVRAAENADARDFIEALGGFEARIADHGKGLSGGQRQRLALARAFLRDAPILILDEPTAALDAATESRVLARLRACAVGRTVILISHRESNLAIADRVLSFHGGKIEASRAPNDSPKLPSEQSRNVS